MVRNKDDVHKEFIINIVKKEYPDFSVDNQWMVSNDGARRKALKRESFPVEVREAVDDEGFESGEEEKENIPHILHNLNLPSVEQLKQLEKLSLIKQAFAEKTRRIQELKKLQNKQI